MRLEPEPLFRTVFDRAGIGIVVRSLDGHILLCNPALCAMLGYTEEEIRGAAPGEYVYEEDAAAATSQFQDLCEGRCERYEVERRYVRKDGELIWGRVRASLAREDSLVVWTIEDITAEVRAERALRERETRLRVMTDQVPAILWTVDTDLRFTSSTGRGLLALGLDPGQVVGMSIYDYLQTRDPEAPAVRSHERALLGESNTYVLSFQEKTYHSYVEPLRDGDAIVGAIGIALDVTSQKQAEEARDESEAMRQTIAESCPDLILLLDLDGCIRFINRPMATLVADTGLGSSVFDYLPEDAHHRVRACFDRVTRSRLPDQYEIEFRTSDGVQWFENRVWPVLRDGEVATLAVYCTDVTARRLLEEQLRHSQKMESIGRLAGGVAHDLNNQLSVILGSTEMARLGSASRARVDAELDRICRAVETAASLTRQLLAFGRQQVLQPRVIDLNSLVADIREMLGRVIGEDVELGLHPDAGLDNVKVDPVQIEQVVLNLAINARDAMPRGGDLTIETSRADIRTGDATGIEPGRYAVLSVADTGTGMEAETLDRVFEPFFTTKEKGKGTGLGLSVVEGIVIQSGGRIVAESEVGVGTTFRIFLPAEEGPAEPEQVGFPQSEPGGSETILLAEDDEFVREAIQGILEVHGYLVLAAPNGAEALDLCQAHRGTIQLLLTDVKMPGMSGHELAREAQRVLPDVKVIYFSGYAENPDEIGAGVFLQKPVQPALLASTVRRVLDVAARA